MRRVLVAAMLVLAACGGGDDDDTAGDDEPAVTTSTEAPAAASDDAEGPEASEGSTTTAAAAEPDGESTTTTEAAGTAHGDAGAASAADAPAPLAAGTYRYRQSGQFEAGPQTFAIPPEGHAEVDPAAADGTQVMRRYIDPEREPVETRLRFDGSGMALVEMGGGSGPTAFRCTFEPPLQLIGWPPGVGHTVSGSADCGSVTVSFDSRITGRAPVQIDGTTYDAYVIESTVTTTGDFESSSEQLDHFVAELRQSTHTETTTEGTFRGVEFTGSTTSDLVSAVPE